MIYLHPAIDASHRWSAAVAFFLGMAAGFSGLVALLISDIVGAALERCRPHWLAFGRRIGDWIGGNGGH